jgi:hypothetical protein
LTGFYSCTMRAPPVCTIDDLPYSKKSFVQ